MEENNLIIYKNNNGEVAMDAFKNRKLFGSHRR